MENQKPKNKIEFSLLDFGLRNPSMNSLLIVQDVIEYARLAERHGFKRIWLAEHHIPDSVAAWYNPFPVLPLIAGTTKKIKVGIAGCQLSIHNAYHLALNYKLLANLFPGRIDMGLAAGSTAENIRQYLDRETLTVEDKRAQVISLLKDEDRLVNEKELIIPPFKGNIPDIWVLSTGYRRLDEVIRCKVNFSRSLFHGLDTSFHRDEFENFKEKYFECHSERPGATLAFAGCCHISDRKAKKIAENCNYTGITNLFSGSIERFRDLVLMYQEQYGYDEFTFLNVARDPEDRRLAIRLIQKAFDL